MGLKSGNRQLDLATLGNTLIHQLAGTQDQVLKFFGKVLPWLNNKFISEVKSLKILSHLNL